MGCDVVMDEEQAAKQANVDGDNLPHVDDATQNGQNDDTDTDDEDNLEEFDQCSTLAICPAIPLATIHHNAESDISGQSVLHNNPFSVLHNLEPGEIQVENTLENLGEITDALVVPTIHEKSPGKRKWRNSKSPMHHSVVIGLCAADGPGIPTQIEQVDNANDNAHEGSSVPIKRSLRLASKLANTSS